MILTLCRSGGQIGSDEFGVRAAKDYGIKVEMLLPKGFKTLDGPKPHFKEEFNAQEHTSTAYPPRTFINVISSDGTIRLAKDFTTAGEVCTLNAINNYKKPYFDVLIKNPKEFTTAYNQSPLIAAQWILSNNIKVLNIAGNASRDIEEWVYKYMTKVFEVLSNDSE